MSWACPTGWFMADPIGTNAARCYRRFLLDSNICLAVPDNYKSGSYSGSCTSNGARLASFSSYSEFYMIAQACGDQADTSNAATYYPPGCWLDGITASPTTSRQAWDWATPANIPEPNAFLVGTERNNFWDANEPTGYWWANNNLPEQSEDELHFHQDYLFICWSCCCCGESPSIPVLLRQDITIAIRGAGATGMTSIGCGEGEGEGELSFSFPVHACDVGENRLPKFARRTLPHYL